MRNKGLIWEPNTHPIGGVHHDVVIGSSEIPTEVDWNIGCTNQGGENSCTGHAFKKLIEGTARVGGYAGAGRAAARAIYALRAEDCPGLEPLPDSGAAPSTIASGLSRFGCVEEGPDEPLTVADRLSVQQLVDAQKFRVTAIALIDLYGDALIVAIKRSLAAGLIPVFAMDVDAAYEQLGPGMVYDGPKGPFLGGHMQAIDAYTPDDIFGVPGSWSVGWASNGRAWITRRALAQLASNVYVARVVPVLT